MRSDINGLKPADADDPDSPFAGRGGDSTDGIVQRAMHDAPNRVELLGWTVAPLAAALLLFRFVAGHSIGVRSSHLPLLPEQPLGHHLLGDRKRIVRQPIEHQSGGVMNTGRNSMIFACVGSIVVGVIFC